MLRWKLCAALAAVMLFSVSAVNAADNTEKLNIKTKEWKGETLYLKEGRVYGDPSVLEKGGFWKIREENGAAYVSVPVLPDGTRSEIRLPVEQDGLVDMTYFASAAGIRYKLNEKKKEIKFEKPKKEKNKGKREKEPVLVMWDPDNDFDPSKPFFSEKAGTRIASPSWGTYDRFVSGRRYYPLDYLRNAKKAGVDVMPLVDNDFDPEGTSDFFADKELREKVLRALTAYASVYDLEGWNIDFENMKPSDADAFTSFTADLSKRMHAMGKKVSVDITVIGDKDSYWNGCYDRKALAEHADYEILMGYDQTAGGSSYAGPVSAYNWLDLKIPELLKEVPPEKLILGLPFYTRVWTGEDGAVSSDVLTLQYVEEFSRRHKIMPLWQEKEKQFYADWRENGSRRRVWMEESRSLSEKLKLLEKYHLAGAAFWRYGFEDEGLYGALEKTL